MKKISFTATKINKLGKTYFDVNLSLISFLENDTTIIYCPALDLSGYGINFKEAQKSFVVTLEEFISYTTSKGTLNKILLKRKWKEQTKNKYKQPNFDELITKNKLLNKVVRNKEFSRYNNNFSILIA